MPSFGISAFLRIIHMNARPQRTELRRRFTPQEGGYDFHSSLRRLAHRLMVEGESLEDLLAASAPIAKEPERLSAQLGLRRLSAWRATNPGPVLAFEPLTVQSPGRTFRITFSPNFGIQVGSQSVAIHVWNTAAPRLEPRLVRAVLSLFANAYRNAENAPDDIAVLCLRTMRLIRLGDAAEVTELGQLVATSIDGKRDFPRTLTPPFGV